MVTRFRVLAAFAAFGFAGPMDTPWRTRPVMQIGNRDE
jgi:hypothetical protein